MRTSQRTLIRLSAGIWYCGGIVLLVKGAASLRYAYLIDTASAWTAVALIAGGLIGLIKSRLLFSHSCLKNIQRIKVIAAPRIWQCFRPGMLIFLAIVIPTGAWISKAAAGSHMLLCGVGALDTSIGVALLASSRVFWTHNALR